MHQVEKVFVGMGDVMRRQALPAILQHLKRKDVSECALLDIATGTG
jgi:hypothetical protein